MSLTLAQALHLGTQQLQQAGFDTAGTDASLLLEHVTGMSRLDQIVGGTQTIEKAEYDAFEVALKRREQQEPVAYITGFADFWGHRFKVTPDVLIPRSDSETLIATLFALLPDKEVQGTIAELGVGSGAVLLSILAECPKLAGFGIDVADAAIKCTANNAHAANVAERLTLMKGEWATPLPEPVNIMISNPPYIPTAEVAELEATVKDWEPTLALDGGADGLDEYRKLIPTAYEKLLGGGLLLLEIGHTQAKDVQALLPRHQWAETKVFTDLAGRDRVIAAVRTL